MKPLIERDDVEADSKDSHGRTPLSRAVALVPRPYLAPTLKLLVLIIANAERDGSSDRKYRYVRTRITLHISVNSSKQTWKHYAFIF